MLHHQNGAAFGNFFDQLRHAVHVLVAHALRRFVQQHQLRLQRQRGGQLQCALAAVGQVDGQFVGKRFKIDLCKQFAGLAMQMVQAAFRLPEMKRGAQVALQRGAHVFQHGHVREYRRNLERANDAATRGFGRLLMGDVNPVEGDDAACRCQKLREQVEKRGFASAIGPDQGMDVPALDFQVNLADRHKAFELFGEALRFKNELS